MTALLVALEITALFGSPEATAAGRINFSKRNEGELGILFSANGASYSAAKSYNSNFRVLIERNGVYRVSKSSSVWFRVNHFNKEQAKKNSFIAVKVTRFHTEKPNRAKFSVFRNDKSSNWVREPGEVMFSESDNSGFNVRSDPWTEYLDFDDPGIWDFGHQKELLSSEFDKQTKHWHATRAASGRSSWMLRKWLLKEADGIFFSESDRAKKILNVNEVYATYDCLLISFQKTDNLNSTEPVIFSVDTQDCRCVLLEIRAPGDKEYEKRTWLIAK